MGIHGLENAMILFILLFSEVGDENSILGIAFTQGVAMSLYNHCIWPISSGFFAPCLR